MRYYEAMAPKSLAFCQHSNIYEECDLIEPVKRCVTFSGDLSDFDEKLEYYTSHDDEREEIAQRGLDHVLNTHTWEHRIDQFARTIED